MKIKKVWAVSFSPTRTSKTVVDAIASGITADDHDSLDLTYPGGTDSKTFNADELVVIGIPVYGGRVAPLAARRLRALKGTNTPAVLVVLYGNREYEDALVELRDIAEEASFKSLSAAAFIGEHSFSSSQAPIASGRPDSADLSVAVSFGREVAGKIDQLQDLRDLPALSVPGTVPYKESVGSPPVTPNINLEACSRCGLCVTTCPGGAITLDVDPEIDVENCIFCCACVKTCPEEAVFIAAPPILEKRQWLHENYSARKEPELFFLP